MTREEVQQRIIRQQKFADYRAGHFCDIEDTTFKEWKRLSKDKKFMAWADPELIISYDNFVEEFGMAHEAGAKLTLDKKMKQWTKDTATWVL